MRCETPDGGCSRSFRDQKRKRSIDCVKQLAILVQQSYFKGNKIVTLSARDETVDRFDNGRILTATKW